MRRGCPRASCPYVAAMGFSGKFFFDGSVWVAEAPRAHPFLIVEVHDSDIAAVDYQPAEGAAGRFYLGYQPRTFFEDPSASELVDNAAESTGFVIWLREVRDVVVEPSAVEELLAVDDDEYEPDNDFAEDTVWRLLALAQLPAPEALPGAGG